MPAGDLVTDPVPEPALAMVRGRVSRLNVAVQVLAESRGDRAVPINLLGRSNRRTSAPVAGVVVSVTRVSSANSSVHSLPQSIPGWRARICAATSSCLEYRQVVHGGRQEVEACRTAAGLIHGDRTVAAVGIATPAVKA